MATARLRRSPSTCHSEVFLSQTRPKDDKLLFVIRHGYGLCTVMRYLTFMSFQIEYVMILNSW